MADVIELTVGLEPEEAEFVNRKVSSGEYDSAGAVLRHGLRSLIEQDADIERWLREEVVPTIDEMENHPERARPVDEVFDELLTELEDRYPELKHQ